MHSILPHRWWLKCKCVFLLLWLHYHKSGENEKSIQKPRPAALRIYTRFDCNFMPAAVQTIEFDAAKCVFVLEMQKNRREKFTFIHLKSVVGDGWNRSYPRFYGHNIIIIICRMSKMKKKKCSDPSTTICMHTSIFQCRITDTSTHWNAISTDDGMYEIANIPVDILLV